MKQLVATFLLGFIIISLGCKKTALVESPSENVSLNGKWVLTETLSDPGDGSGKWKIVDTQNALYLTLNADSTVKSDGLFGSGSYRTINNSIFEVLNSSSNKRTFSYKIEGQVLTLGGGGCIEACGWKFQKVM